MASEMTGRGQRFELDVDTHVQKSAPGRYDSVVSGRWTVGGGPNGGYLAAIVLRAVLGESLLPDPLTMTVHYLSRPSVAPCEITVSELRAGRGHATYRAELVQDDEVRCAALCTLGQLRGPGPADFQLPAPPVARPEGSVDVGTMGPTPTLWQRLEMRAANKDDFFFLRSEPGEALTGGWSRLADGRPTDALAVAVFLDSFPPAVLNRTMSADPGGAPTLEYTVHWRNKAASTWCYSRLETRALVGGYVDERGELWDEAGTLIAESSQLARYLGATRASDKARPDTLSV